MKFKSIIERVPVDSMEIVKTDCYEVWGKSFTYFSPKFTFTNGDEALEYVKILSKEKIGSEPVKEVYMNEYKAGDLEACAFAHCMYDRGNLNEDFIWE